MKPLNGSFPVTFGRETQQWTLPARKPTGTYLAPGNIATVSVPLGLVNAVYQVRVGAHSWDLLLTCPCEAGPVKPPGTASLWTRPLSLHPGAQITGRLVRPTALAKVDGGV